jgi:uncharacterized protein YjiS (DUF1127 family)
MASFKVSADVSESAHRSQPVGLAVDVNSVVLLITQSALKHSARLMGKLRTWRRRERERTELARMSQAELHDIRVSSSDRWTEISKPFWRQ